MKMIKYFGLLSVAGLLMTCVGCGDPVMPEPPTTDLEANITIRELIGMYPAEYAVAIDTALYIEGVVTGNDVGGSLYKKIYVQDETAGIDIEIEMTQNCHKYPVGQRLVIDLNGLAFGRYGGQPQIGRQGSIIQTGRLYESDCDAHFHRKGYASAAEEIAPVPIKLSDATRSRYVGMLVRFDDVQFAKGGDIPFADVTVELSGNAQNDSIISCNPDNSETLILRVSQYALFAMDTLPTGCGSIIGILGIYNSTPQLFIRDKNDLIGFEE